MSSPPIARYLLRIVTVLSLLLCVATCGLWVRSYFRFDTIEYVPSTDPRVGQRFHHLASGNGSLCYVHIFSSEGHWTPGWIVQAFPITGIDVTSLCRESGSEWHGFGYFSVNWAAPGATAESRREFGVLAPYWSLAVLLAPLPIRWMFVHCRRTRCRRGFCTICGYDLRATTDRYPECGAIAVFTG